MAIGRPSPSEISFWVSSGPLAANSSSTSSPRASVPTEPRALTRDPSECRSPSCAGAPAGHSRWPPAAVWMRKRSASADITVSISARVLSSSRPNSRGAVAAHLRGQRVAGNDRVDGGGPIAGHDARIGQAVTPALVPVKGQLGLARGEVAPQCARARVGIERLRADAGGALGLREGPQLCVLVARRAHGEQQPAARAVHREGHRLGRRPQPGPVGRRQRQAQAMAGRHRLGDAVEVNRNRVAAARLERLRVLVRIASG